MKNQSLEKKAREVILGQMEELSVLDTESVMELIKPHFSPDIVALREQALRRKANQLMSKFRDDKGVRKCFAFNDEGISKYINVDTTEDVEALSKVARQLNDKYKGIGISIKKISRRQLELSDQISFDDLKKVSN